MREQHVIALIEARAASTGLAPSTICERAVQNTRLYSRLVAGGSCSVKIFNKICKELGDEGVEHGETVAPQSTALKSGIPDHHEAVT